MKKNTPLLIIMAVLATSFIFLLFHNVKENDMTVLGPETTIDYSKINAVNGVFLSACLDNEIINYIITNNSQNTIGYGVDVLIEKENNNVWYSVAPTKEYVVPAILLVLEPDKKESYTIELSYWQPLSSGKYRLLKKLLTTGSQPDYLSWEFVLE